MITRVIATVLACAFLSATARASELVDKQYAFKSIIPLVIANTKEELYRRETEKAVAAAIRQNPRFVYSDRALLALQGPIKSMEHTEIGTPSNDNTRFLQPLYKEMVKWQVDSSIVVEIQILNQDSARLSAFLVNTADGYIIHAAQAPVENRRYIQHYIDASKFVVSELSSRIPFQANVASRDKFRVILDQGYNKFHKGQRLTVSTMEMTPKGMEFVDTGIILVTQAERDITFAKILVENHPLEVAQANKVRGEMPENVGKIPALSRAIAAAVPQTIVTSAESIGTKKPKYGFAEAALAPTSVSMSNLLQNGTERTGGGLMFTAIKLNGELWVTANLFVDASLMVGTGSVTPDTSSTGIGMRYVEMRGWGGYRHYFGHPDADPSLYFKAGLSKQNITFSDDVSPGFFSNMSHTGLFVGGGGKYPITPKYGIELDLMTVVLGDFAEGPRTSGSDIIGTANWEMSLKGYYQVNREFDGYAKIFFNHASAGFTGVGTRTTPASSIAQTNTGVLLGASYRF